MLRNEKEKGQGNSDNLLSVSTLTFSFVIVESYNERNAP